MRAAGIAMTREPTDIEVEVVEIDGVAPVAPEVRTGAGSGPSGDWQDWRSWQGRARQLDHRWWPLWVALGFIGLVLLVTVGLVLGAVFLVARLILKIVRAIAG
jgi:hypothetical protein